MKRFAVMAILALAACSSQGAPSDSPDAGSASRPDVGVLLNAERAALGLPTLTQDARLAAAARVHAQDMARAGLFSHTGSDGSTPAKRVTVQGYGYCYVAENIAKGQQSATQTMQSWMTSPGHRRNNLSRDARDFGAAQAEGNIWVLVFGRSGCGG